MNKKRLLSAHFLWPVLATLAFLGLLARPAAGQQTAVTVEQVTPGHVANASGQTLTVIGQGFAADTAVTLAGFGGLPTRVVSSTTLTIDLPPLVTPGLYDLVVANREGGAFTAPAAVAVMGPTAVQPATVSNVAPTELVITGVEFADGAVVILENYGALGTIFVSPNMLRAQLPAGVPPAVYAIRVVNPDASASVLNNALTITAPPATPGPTETPQPTKTPAPTTTPAPTAFVRPLIVVQSYGASSAQITPGTDFDFELTLVNSGQVAATNVVAAFVSGDFVPRATGGVRAIGGLNPGQPSRFWQPLSASPDLRGKTTGVLEVKVSYTDVNGTAYTDSFALTFAVVRQSTGPGATATPTPTPTASPTAGPRLRPQLLIGQYTTSVDLLEPGARFSLEMSVHNQGSADAKRVTIILGGGSSGGGGTLSGTPEPNGGVSGAGGEFSNFAPIGSSNLRYLGDLAQGETLTASQDLIVNASTKPGAYPVKVSFVYNDAGGGNYSDEQVITLLVYGRPSVDVNFYVEPPPFFAGQPNQAPIQIVNTGKSTAVFGSLSVSAAGAQLMNSSAFVGALESGGYFPIDATVIPDAPGTLELLVRVGYLDDFNRQQVITQTLSVEVQEAPVFEEPIIDPGMGGPGDPGAGPAFDPASETLSQKVWRFIRGMVGLSSAPAQAAAGDPMMGGPMDGPGGFPLEGPIQ